MNPNLKDWLMFFVWLGALPLLLVLCFLVMFIPWLALALVLVGAVLGAAFLSPPTE